MASDDGKKAAKPLPPKNPRLAELQKRAEAASANRGKPVDISTFFQEAIVELKKTTWPSRPVLVKSTMVVLSFIGAVGVWVAVLDFFLSRILQFVTGR